MSKFLKHVLMAKAEQRSAGGKTEAKQPPAAAAQPPAVQQGGAVANAAPDYEADAGKGMEGVDKDSQAIPFLTILQPLSPIVVDSKVEGAKAGLLANSVTNELFGESAYIIPCAFQRRFIRWAARDTGGGFKGEFTPQAVQELRAAGKVKEVDGRLYFPEQDGSVNEKRSDRCSDTRNHFCILVRKPEDVVGIPILFSVTSTGIKTSKQFISRIDAIKMKRSDGSEFPAPSFSHMYKVSTLKKTNDKGTWWMPQIDMVGQIKNGGLYALAKAFHDQVVSGKVDVAHDSVAGNTGTGTSASDDGAF